MKKGQFIIGALIAAAAGAVAGILTAPKSGKETRADLKSKANELKDEATDKAKQEVKIAKDKLTKKPKSTEK